MVLSIQSLRAEEAPIKLDAKIEFVRVYNGQTRVDLHVFEKDHPKLHTEDVLCNLFLTEVSKGGMMGSLITDKQGNSSYVMVNKFTAADDSIDKYLFIARIVNDKRFVPTNIYREFKKSHLSVDFLSENDHFYVKGQFNELLPDSSLTPIADATVSILIKQGDEYQLMDKRTYTTDGKGAFNIAFKGDWVGDEGGHIDLMVKVVHQDYGTSEYLQTMDWGLSPSEAQIHKKGNQRRNLTILILAIGLISFYMLIKNKKRSA